MALNQFYIWLLFVTIKTTLCQEKGSLTFVVDVTGSMWTDIQKVKESADDITDIVLKKKISQVEDLIIVSFNDDSYHPYSENIIRLHVKTSNESIFKKALNELDIMNSDNYECPEKSLRGIEKGLKESRFGSYIFVFTDNGSSDVDKETKIQNIKRMCQEKQAQIDFVITPNNLCIYGKNFDLYKDIAGACGGQFFRLTSKDEVKQVTDYVGHTITGKGTPEVSMQIPPNKWSEVQFSLEGAKQYALVSISGDRAVEYYIPKTPALYNKITVVNTRNVKIFKISGIGDYEVRMKGQSVTSVVVYVERDFTFQHGFSKHQLTEFNGSEKRTTIDEKYHLMILVDDPSQSIKIDKIEILVSEKIYMELPLNHLSGDFYSTDLFLPPNVMYNVAVIGKTPQGKTLRRITKTPVTPFIPDDLAPKITNVDTDHLGVETDTYHRISCNADGYPIPTVTWYFKNHTKIINSENFSVENETLILKLRKNMPDASFICKAVNRVGQDEKIFNYSTIDSVNYTSTNKLYVLKGSNVRLNCSVNHTDSDVVYWYKDSLWNHTVSSGPYLYIEDALVIKDDGNYTCRVSNYAGGSISGPTIEVLVGLPPKFLYKYKAIEWKGNKDAQILACGVTQTTPASTHKWFYNGQKISDESSTLHISKFGNYTCEVSNIHGSLRREIIVTSTKVCLINKAEMASKNMPLILNKTNLGWPHLKLYDVFMNLPAKTNFIVSCESKNNFKIFPTKTNVTAVCDHEDKFLVDGKLYKFTELECQSRVKPNYTRTEVKCLNENSVTITAGFNVPDHVKLFELCIDTTDNVTAYAKIVLPQGPEKISDTMSDVRVYGKDVEYVTHNSKCEFERTSLVNARDITYGPAQVAADNAYNEVFALSCHNMSWSHVENFASKLSFNGEVIVWTGASHYQNKVPRYLWKVIKDKGSDTITAMVYVNDFHPRDSDRLCHGECKKDWLSRAGWTPEWPIYCCEIEEFKNAFGLPDSIFV